MHWLVCLGIMFVGLGPTNTAKAQSLNASAYQVLQPTSKLEALENELKETRDRLQAFENENESLHRRNDANKQAIRILDESLAVANVESEFFRRQYSDLKLRMEALGMESVGDNKEALEQRLLKAVRDLSLTQQVKEEISERLLALSEAVMLFIKSASSSNIQLRLDVEGQLRAANLVLDELTRNTQIANNETLPDLTNARVVSVKDEYALIVANVGARQGVKAGMPFRVIRGGRGVATVRVVTVRDRICGAVVEEYTSSVDAIKVGDQMHVDAQQ